MNNPPESESRLRRRLDEIKAVPPRDPRAASLGRARFLAQAAAAREARRSNAWLPTFRMQQFAMNTAVTVLVIVGLLIGGGTTVKAAQDELPGQPLYAVKTFSEDISLQFQSSPESKVDRLMQLAQNRVQEMTRLVGSGQTPTAQVSQRLEQHLQQALQLCSSMDDAALSRTLPRVRAQLQQQTLDTQRLETQAGPGAKSILANTHAMLQGQLQVVDDGLANHELFRTTVHNELPHGQTQTPGTATPTSTPLVEQASPITAEPGNAGNNNGLGPNTNPGASHAHMTPTPRPNAGGNNSGGNDNNNGKGKDKNPKDNRPATKTPK
jgi:hypothetical protein